MATSLLTNSYCTDLVMEQTWNVEGTISYFTNLLEIYDWAMTKWPLSAMTHL